MLKIVVDPSFFYAVNISHSSDHMRSGETDTPSAVCGCRLGWSGCGYVAVIHIFWSASPPPRAAFMSGRESERRAGMRHSDQTETDSTMDFSSQGKILK